jgi:predicted SAM-dependent methyltransferase
LLRTIAIYFKRPHSSLNGSPAQILKTEREVYVESAFRKWVKRNVRVGVRRSAKFALFEIRAATLTFWTKLAFHPPNVKDLKLNVGAGVKRKQGWVNVDLHPAADIKTDARRKLPFRSNSASIIYSEHFFEHLEYPEEAMTFLSESFRVLAPGGSFSVGVPDTELCLRAYLDGCFSPQLLGLTEVEWCKTPMQYLNFLFHQGGEHRQLYDFATLSSVLQNAGFVDVRRREFNVLLDSEDRRLGTLYVEAVKPPS